MTSLLTFTAQTILAGLWQGVALVVAVALALRLLPRLQPSIRFTVWALTFATIVALPFLHSASHATAAPAFHLGIGWAVALVVLWATAAVTRLTLLLTQAVRLRRIWSRATPVPHPTTLIRGAQLCTSPDVDTPSVVGFFSPRLLIPAWLHPTLTPAELNQIILHECEHLRRRDDWINLAQNLALALFPLNPALLLADRQLSLERELACDAGVVAATSAPFDYASCLTRLAERRLSRPRTIVLALSAWSRQSELARRVHSLLRPSRAFTPSQLRASLAALTLAFTAGTVELARAPHLIDFTTPIAAAVLEAPAALPLSGAKVLPVVYHPPTQPLTPRPALKPHRSTHRPAFAAVATRRPLPGQPHVLLTVAHAAAASTPRVVDTVLTDLSPTYAAVPFANGWLIFQL